MGSDKLIHNLESWEKSGSFKCKNIEFSYFDAEMQEEKQQLDPKINYLLYKGIGKTLLIEVQKDIKNNLSKKNQVNKQNEFKKKSYWSKIWDFSSYACISVGIFYLIFMLRDIWNSHDQWNSK